MKTFDLIEAAEFLKLHPEELRVKAKAGLVPGAKAGKRWVFIDLDLADYLRSLYAAPRQALRVLHKEKSLCHSRDVDERGGSTSPRRADSALDALLARKTK